jgi:hypothetical protein
MNSPFVVEQAKALASRAEVVSAVNSEAKVQALYGLIYARPADADEVAAGIRFLDAPVESGSLADVIWQYAQALLLANEFVFVD